MRRPFIMIYLYNLRNNISSSFNRNCISFPNIQAGYFIKIMNACMSDGYSSNQGWLKFSYRRYTANPSYLKGDRFNNCSTYFCWKLPSDSPSRCTGDLAQFILKGELINFINNSVNLIR